MISKTLRFPSCDNQSAQQEEWRRRHVRQISHCSFPGLFRTRDRALGCAATQRRESTGEYVDDSVITTKVKAAILDEATLKTFQINVQTFKGSFN